ncbi:MAG TPA: TlpA disulfide reductase family protein [Methylomirabilota bacterium]|nr:TlpA disulfide reductase family protein [Methylomirabilota bacterium]
MRPGRRAGTTLGAALLAAGLLFAAPSAGPAADPTPEAFAALQLVATPRTAAPPLALSDLDGRSVSLASLRGDVVLLYFWATWCPYCEKELPTTVEQLARRYRDRRLSVLAVNIEEGRGKVLPWIRRHGVTVPVLLDVDGDVTSEYRVTATPTAVLIDREGKMLARAVGTRPWTDDRGRALWDTLLK